MGQGIPPTHIIFTLHSNSRYLCNFSIMILCFPESNTIHLTVKKISQIFVLRKSLFLSEGANFFSLKEHFENKIKFKIILKPETYFCWALSAVLN